MKPTNTAMNLNYTDQYIQAKRDFGSTTYYNVNTNTSTLVPWGHVDWINFTLGSVLTVGLNVGIIYFIGHWAKVW